MVRVFLIGDSISLDYGKYLDRFLDKEIALYGKSGRSEAYQNLDVPVAANGGDSSMVLKYLVENEQGIAMHCDYMFFNCGLHDIKHNRESGKVQILLSAYVRNLQDIVALLQEHGIKPVFINTTPAATERYSPTSSFYRLTEDVLTYNAAAEEVMQKKNIPVIDLYSFTMALGLTGDGLFRDHTHFREEVIRMHAAFIAGEMNAFVKTNFNHL